MEGKDWNELRKEVRKLESDIELKLVSYSKLGISYSGSMTEEDYGVGTSSMYSISHSMSVEIEQLLSDVGFRKLFNVMRKIITK